MPILSGDVKLLKSAVMADVPEGGGAPTGAVIADGVSNAIFPDISELDRAGGRVSLRKTFVAVDTADHDTYFGANVIVADPPADPRVSVTLFSTRSTFDTRADASVRVESYLNQGPEWGGYLFENHIVGQRVIQLFQRPDAEVPNVGQTLVLIWNEGQPTQKLQYIRATKVASVERLFYDPDSGKDYPAAVVTVDTSDSLRYDFTGSPAARSFTRVSTATKTRDTVVADAGTYVGVVPLTTAAVLGDFTVAASSIFTQLVPSAQTETPIADIRANGLSAALVATGGPITQSLTVVLTTTQRLHVGGPILPGSLSTTANSITAIDEGGLLTVAGAEVGQVDYDNGIITMSTNVWGAGAASHTLTFTPAAVPDLISDQSAIRVTPETRSLNYVVTMGNIPAPRTLSVSYLAQGRWYVLRDNGAGVLKGISNAFGVGTVSYITGTVSITLGALPDVGSSIILQSYNAATTTAASNTDLTNAGRLFTPINSDGAISNAPGTKKLVPGAVTISWAGKTATDDGAGALTGDASGSVSYSTGVILFSPTITPAPGTVVTVLVDDRTQDVAIGVLLAGGSLGATDITPQSVSFDVLTSIAYAVPSGLRLDFELRQQVITVKDTAGNLYFVDEGITYLCGTINYTTGVVNFVPPTLGVQDSKGPMFYGPGIWNGITGEGPTRSYRWGLVTTGWVGYTRIATYASAANISYSNAVSSSNTFSVTMDNLFLQVPMVPNYALKGVGFAVGSTRYQQLTDGTLLKDVLPDTGGGTPAGTVGGSLGLVTLISWPTGASSTVTNWRGLLTPPSVGVAAPFSSFGTTFRTAASPLRPGSLSVLGTMQDGTPINVTAGIDGTINATRVKGRVDYQYGLVELYFVNPAGDASLNIDLTHLGIAGLTTIPADLVMLNSLRYNAVSYSYLPLDAELLGIDPVRLPSDGRVPIFRAGGFAVVGHTGEITATVTNAQVIDCARVRLSRVRLVGADGIVINSGYTVDLEAGLVTIVDNTGYSQPVTIQHRIEDMAVVRETQISGAISFTRPLTHNYPLGSFVSSAMIAGDLFARTQAVFDQATWNGTWVDSVVGGSATATYNTTTFPIAVTNKGALTERWVIQFTNTTAFNVIGEHVGVIATGSTGADCAPINPATMTPYFTILAAGWGAGWAVGNVLRINTIGAEFPVWVVRTVQQGPETVTDDSFTLLIRGDVDTP